MTEESLKKRKQVLLDLVNEKSYVPMKAKELAVLLQVSKEERSDLDYVLKELVASGELSVNKRGKYSKPEITGLVGTFSATAKDLGLFPLKEKKRIFILKKVIQMELSIRIPYKFFYFQSRQESAGKERL